MNSNPICDFGIDKDALQYIGHDLQRPECILAEPDGTLWSADARGGVVRIAPDGTQQIVTQRQSGHFRGRRSEASRYLAGHAAERPRLRPQRRFPDLELRHRLARDHDARRRARASRQHHRRPAGRQGELRPARLEGPHLGHGLDAGQELDARAPRRSRRRLPRALRGRRRSASSPTDSGSPTRFGSTRKRSCSTSSRRPAAASPRLRIDEQGRT